MKQALMVIAGLVVLALGGVAVWWFTSTDIEGTGEVTAPTLASSTESTEAAESYGTETTTGGTVAPDTSSATDTPVAAGSTIFELAEESTVTFQIDEVLNGSPKTVVATNTEVAAQLSVDPADLSATEVGTIVVGAQTFETDSGNRNRAIRGPILDGSTFQTIEFVPTAIEGLTGEATVGEPIEFEVAGDLTIRDVTNLVTFTVSATMTDASTIEGTAESMVSRESFGLNIPSVPQVADVSDEIFLAIDFVAVPVS